MKLINPGSLAATLDALNEASFYETPLSKSQREGAAIWIAGPQGEPGSYAEMFAPTEIDYAGGARLFTGEAIRSRAGMGHILGEEACRALLRLDVSLDHVQDALARATAGMLNALMWHEERGNTLGMYCCRTCTLAMWRNLAAGGLEDSERRLTAGMKALKSHRDGKGRWKGFPFYYTLLALSEIDLRPAIEEMRYGAPAYEHVLRRSPRDDKFARRRRLLAERVLEKC